MPKAGSAAYPITTGGLLGVHKPSMMLCMPMLNDLKPLFAESPIFAFPDPFAQSGGKNTKRKRQKNVFKMGQGGTLDELASGVLVLGLGAGTKQLGRFLECSKEYRAIGLLGTSTDSYDSQGKVAHRKPHTHITREAIESILPQFRGEISQIPPIFSALKMDGKALYEYARTNTPLPRPIEARKVTVHELELVNFIPATEHAYEPPKEAMDWKYVQKLERLVEESTGEQVPDERPEPVEDVPAAAFEIKMKVSGGTYVRTIVHDIAQALGSAAHVVLLQRTRQGDFVLAKDDNELADGQQRSMDWQILQTAIDEKKARDGPRSQGIQPWEEELLRVVEVVEK